MPTSSNASVTRQSPQLMMRRRDLSSLPELSLASGYTARHFEPGDESAWDQIIREAFEKDAPEFEGHMRRDPAFRPERIWFICRDNVPVATASAWRQAQRQPMETGTLHMVGILPAEGGKGLGLQVSLAALQQMQREGRKAAVLSTDDDRLAAIKTYLRLGFEPLVSDENHRERWPLIFEALRQPELTAQFKAALTAPV